MSLLSRGIFCFALCMMLIAVSSSADAQQPTKIPRIGYQSASSSGENNEEAFRQGLRELGYVDGQNIVIEWRFAQGKPDQVKLNAAELVRLKVDVIVTGGATDTLAAKEATSTIPIVMTNESDPVRAGLVVSLSRPGGNITGLAEYFQSTQRETGRAAQGNLSTSLTCNRPSGARHPRRCCSETERGRSRSAIVRAQAPITVGEKARRSQSRIGGDL